MNQILLQSATCSKTLFLSILVSVTFKLSRFSTSDSWRSMRGLEKGRGAMINFMNVLKVNSFILAYLVKHVLTLLPVHHRLFPPVSYALELRFRRTVPNIILWSSSCLNSDFFDFFFSSTNNLGKHPGQGCLYCFSY